MNQKLDWRKLLHALPDVAWIKDEIGIYQACNKGFEALLGLSEADILGKNDSALKQINPALCLDALACEHSMTQPCHVTFADDGHSEYLVIQHLPILSTDGDMSARLGIGRDISYQYALLESMQDGFVALNAKGNCQYINQHAADYLQRSPAALLGKNIWKEFPDGIGENFEKAYHHVMETRQALCVENYFEPWNRWFESRIYPHQNGITIFFTDITEYKQREFEESLRLKIFEKLLQSDSLLEILSDLVIAHESFFTGTVCSILLVDEHKQTLNRGAAPGLPEFFNQALTHLPIESGQGPCCTAAHLKKTVITENIQESVWSDRYKGLLQKAGLAACWSEPILGSENKVLGTFAIYRFQPGVPSESEKSFIASIVSLASLAIEKNLTHSQLIESENNYRTLINTIPDLVWLKDLDGCYMMCNSRFEDFIGASETEIKGKTDFDFVDAESALLFRDKDQQVFATRQSISFEESLTFAADGYTGVFETIKTPLISPDGDVLGVLGVARDISKTRSVLQSLQDREALIATMFGQTTDSILLVDPKTQTFIDFNDAACQTLGYSREEFAQLHIGDIQAELNPEQRNQVIQRVHNGRALNFETQHRHKDGSIRDIELTLRPITLAGKKLNSAVWRDITEAKKAKSELELYHDHLEELVSLRTRELQASEYRFRKLVEDIKQDYIFFSVGDAQLITYLSPSAEEFFAQKMEDMIGKPWYEVFHLGVSAQEQGEQIIVQMRRGEAPPPFEIEVEIKGQRHILEITEHIRYDHTGALLGGEGVIKNITRQKQIEAELREAKDIAEKSSQAKSRFLSNMSHELRSPLNIILGYSEILQQKIAEPRLQQYVDAVNSSGHTLLNIINDILDLSKIEAGKIELQLKPVSLYEFTKEIELMVVQGFEQKGLGFEVVFLTEISQALCLDSLRVRQILLNLLNNALKYTQKGKVVLSLAYQDVDSEKGELFLSVRDTGVGMSAEFQNRLFAPFEQEVQSGQTNSGTGLGLAISRNLVSLMHGQIFVESEQGQGTTFKVILPVLKSSQSDLSNHSDKAPFKTRFAPARLLLVDDLPQNLHLLQTFLENQPFELLIANNGLEACQLAQKNQPELILMDIKMPRMNGFEALNILKADQQTQAIPVVALTAYSLQHEAQNFLKQGFDAYLRKPVSQSALEHCLRQFLKTESHHINESQSTSSTLMRVEESVSTDSLNQDWRERWQKIQDSLLVDELESFALDLSAFANHFQISELQSYAQNLLQQIQSFALEDAHNLLLDFPSIFEKNQP